MIWLNILFVIGMAKNGSHIAVEIYRKAVIARNKRFGNNTLTTKIIENGTNKMDI